MTYTVDILDEEGVMQGSTDLYTLSEAHTYGQRRIAGADGWKYVITQIMFTEVYDSEHGEP